MESSKDTDLSFARDPNENEMSIGPETTQSLVTFKSKNPIGTKI